MNYVFVLDKNRNPMNMCTYEGATEMWETGKAETLCNHPLAIIRTDDVAAKDFVHEPLLLTVDYKGLKTRFYITKEISGKVTWSTEVSHMTTNPDPLGATTVLNQSLDIVNSLLDGNTGISPSTKTVNEILSVMFTIMKWVPIKEVDFSGNVFEALRFGEAEATPATAYNQPSLS